MNRTLVRSALLGLVFVLTALSPVGAQNGPRTVMVWVDDFPRPWGESQIEELLLRKLSMSGNLRVFAVNEGHHTGPAFPRDWTNADSLADWAQEQGCRYVLAVDVRDERLERRKSFHLPLIFHQYTTVGVVEADVRLFDAGRGKFVMTESLKVEKKGPRLFQATVDNDINDPDLHLTTPRKLTFMAQLEQKFCDEVVKRMGERVYLRHQDSQLR